ncbi:MAG: hypothetical protein WKF75_02910 [Singulisphaera sp.]
MGDAAGGARHRRALEMLERLYPPDSTRKATRTWPRASSAWGTCSET